MYKFIYAVAIFCIYNSISLFSTPEKKDSLNVYRLEGITVSTNRAEERKSPVAFSEISQKEISRIYTGNDLPQMLSELPSIISYSENGNSIGYSNLTMRGFDQRRISVMINGIPQNDPEDHNFYWINVSDIASTTDNIQVQRGAGFSSYGSAAIGGSINLTTTNILREKGIKLSYGAGFQDFGANDEMDFNSSRISLSAGSGLIDNKYAVFGKFSRINSNGYRDQSFAYLNSWYFAASRIDKNFTTQINFYGGSQDDGLAYTGVPKSFISDKQNRLKNYNYWSYDSTGQNVSWTTDRRKQEVEYFSQPSIELLNDWKICGQLTFKSALFFKKGEGYFDYDGTGWTDAESFRLNEKNGYLNSPDPTNAIIRAFVSNNYGGWIPRLIWNHEDGVLIAGAEIRLHNSEHWGKINFAENLPENYNPDFKFYSYFGGREIFSAFARESYNLNDDITLSAEFQIVHHNYRIYDEKDGLFNTKYLDMNGNEIIANGDLFNINYVFFNPRFGINYNQTDKINHYFSVAYTSREPRMNNLYRASDAFYGKTPLFEGKIINDSISYYDFTKPLVKPEKMIDIEIGTTYKDETNFINVNAYLMFYKDELVKSGKLDIFGAPVDGNAPSTSHIGIELQGSNYILKNEISNLKFSYNATYSINKINEFDYVTGNGQKISLKDNDIAGFPEVIANLRIAYQIENFYISALYKYVGEFYTDNFSSLIQTNQELINDLNDSGEYYFDNINPAYSVINLDLSYTFVNIMNLNHFKIQGQIYNLTNSLFSAGAIGKEFFPAAERNFYIGFELGL